MVQVPGTDGVIGMAITAMAGTADGAGMAATDIAADTDIEAATVDTMADIAVDITADTAVTQVTDSTGAAGSMAVEEAFTVEADSTAVAGTAAAIDKRSA